MTLLTGLAIIIASVLPPATAAQGVSERDAVLTAVQAFFDSMTARDVDRAREVLVPQGRFHAANLRGDGRPDRSFATEEYLADLKASKQVMRERIWNPEIRIHGRIATIWAPYDFWIDGQFSHCGVDAFDLVKTEKGWKIAGGAYTLESKCEPSPLGPLKQ